MTNHSTSSTHRRCSGQHLDVGQLLHQEPFELLVAALTGRPVRIAVDIQRDVFPPIDTLLRLRKPQGASRNFFPEGPSFCSQQSMQMALVRTPSASYTTLKSRLRRFKLQPLVVRTKHSSCGSAISPGLRCDYVNEDRPRLKACSGSASSSSSLL